MSKSIVAAATALLLLVARAAGAGPAAYVHSPIVDYGEREVDVHGGSAKLRDGTRESELVTGWGIGLKPWWFTEAYLVFAREKGESLELEAIEWENIFQLTETGRHAADLGLLLEIERPRDHAEGYEFVFGPLLQGDVGQVQLNGNLLFERHVRAEVESETEMRYEWQAKLRWRRELEPGLQGFGEMGEWNHWAPSSEQSHVWGPALFGKMKFGEHQAVKYDAAYLVAASHAAPKHLLRFRVEFEY